MNYKERMLKIVGGEMVDKIPFVPRLDLWFKANKANGTLPPEYQDVTNHDEIARSEGWGIHKIILEYSDHGLDAVIDYLLGVYKIPSQSYFVHLPDNIERVVKYDGEELNITYVTPVGNISGKMVYSEKTIATGATEPGVREHLLKGPDDYKVAAYIFKNLIVEPEYEKFTEWSAKTGDDGFAVTYGFTAGSPMHHILKVLAGPGAFFMQFIKHESALVELADSMMVYFDKVLDVVKHTPGEVVVCGANFDSAITYPPFFDKYISPWLKKVVKVLHENNKLVLLHTDGENKALMNQILETGADIAEAICPSPMTKVSIGEFYQKWSGSMTLFGGIPSVLLCTKITSDSVFNDYLKELASAIKPGTRMILGVGDATPPDADFERIRTIAKFAEENFRLPL